MDDTTVVMGWAALGMAVSFVGMILPFKRGAQGVTLNMLVAVLGALAGGALGRAIGAYDRLAAPLSFGFAVVTSFAATILVHYLVVRRARGALT